MNDQPRLIERAFPLKQASLDSVHEKNVRHGHISTLHIWPARRPLAACRAALIATLLPDPGNAEEGKRLIDKIGGRIKAKTKKTADGKLIEAEETEGGILHWGRESDPDMDYFRAEIRKAYGGRAPRVLDPFAGGGAIPLEAMRLGCEVTASDINPVAWFILKCTLEYPQKLAGQKRPLPEFALKDREFMESFFKAQGLKGARLERQLEDFGLGKTGDNRSLALVGEKRSAAADGSAVEADLAWHVRAWGRWVLERARKDLERFYPVIDGKPTVAYLWARTVKCKNCRALIPLLKTKWLCKKDKKRVLLKVEPNADKTGVGFGVLKDVPQQGGNAAQRRAFDKEIGKGTMSRAGATCPCCTVPSMTMEDIRLEGKAGRLGAVMTAVVVDGPDGKEYRLATEDEIRLAAEAANEVDRVFAEIPFGIPDEPLPSKEALGFRVPLYGFDRWYKLFTPRQLLALGTFVKNARTVPNNLITNAYPSDWVGAIIASLAVCADRLADRNSEIAWWQTTAQKVGPTFTRWALPITWDHVEICPWADLSGSYPQAIDWVAEVFEHLTRLFCARQATVEKGSAIQPRTECYDVVVTDPPYYDAIPYSDLMDFYYVWLRRSLHGISEEVTVAFREPLGPKWDNRTEDGELIDDSSRFDGNKVASKSAYENGMFRAFQECDRALVSDGRMVVVFANKSPDAWETLVSAMIRAGFVVDGSWPIQTERVGRIRSVASAALSSSVWLVCKKRPEIARPGWDNVVLDQMRENIYTRLREYWDAGIRGPDFVWAATGPALEAYSKHPVVRKANEPGKILEVSEFLRAVRRIVVDFVVGRFLSDDRDEGAASGLDDVTTYYLLHRHDFGLNEAPIGACILYAFHAAFPIAI